MYYIFVFVIFGKLSKALAKRMLLQRNKYDKDTASFSWGVGNFCLCTELIRKPAANVVIYSSRSIYALVIQSPP